MDSPVVPDRSPERPPGLMSRGLVVEFDEAAGLGVVEGEDGLRHGFHCTAVADGSRSISVGTPVWFDLVPGRDGRWEAGALHPVG